MEDVINFSIKIRYLIRCDDDSIWIRFGVRFLSQV